MTLASYLLFAMGLLGAADILCFHMLAHGLRAHPPARFELVTHFLRGPTYAVLFALVPNFAFHGAWFGVLLGVLAFDLAISIADFWCEPESRRALGGLPRGEYVLHVLLAMFFGALVLAVVDEGAAGWSEPTALVWLSDGPPALLRVVLGGMAPLVLATGLLDLAAVRRLGRAAR
jgi:hypothetical protein